MNLHANRLVGQFYIDWMPARTKSLIQNTGAFVYTNGTFTEVFPTPDNKLVTASATLKEFFGDVGTPEKLKSNRAKEFCGRNLEFVRTAKKRQIDLIYSEPEHKNQIYDVDLKIQETRCRTHNKMKSKNVPKCLWDYCHKHSAQIRQIIPCNKLQGQTALESVTGRTPDISEYCDFDFYDLVWYHPGIHPSISKDNRALDRWTGISHQIGSDMCYWILTDNGDVIAETTVQHVLREEYNDPDIKPQIEQFNASVITSLDDTNFQLEPGTPLALDDDSEAPWDSQYDKNAEPLADADDVYWQKDSDDFVV